MIKEIVSLLFALRSKMPTSFPAPHLRRARLPGPAPATARVRGSRSPRPARMTRAALLLVVMAALCSVALCSGGGCSSAAPKYCPSHCPGSEIAARGTT